MQAFGMGVDKPDVRCAIRLRVRRSCTSERIIAATLCSVMVHVCVPQVCLLSCSWVVHWDAPRSLTDFYQSGGRSRAPCHIGTGTGPTPRHVGTGT